MKKLSVIIPAYNEAGSLPKLLSEIVNEISQLNIKDWEVLVVDDGSRDGTDKAVVAWSKKERRVRLLSLSRNEGKALALQAGFDNADGDIIITMDADGQDDPKEMGRFVEKINEDYDVVSGWKTNRKDGFIKNNTSHLYNYFTNLLLKTKLHDSNCGYKAYRRRVVQSLDLYGELHRYIPALAEAGGFLITEIGVNHRHRISGRTKYGTSRFLKGALDLLTITFITKFQNRPLHAFGMLGLAISGIGIIIGAYLTWLRLNDQKIGDRPLLLLSILLIVVGVQIVMTGLIGELITSLHKSKRYQVREIL